MRQLISVALLASASVLASGTAYAQTQPDASNAPAQDNPASNPNPTTAPAADSQAAAATASTDAASSPASTDGTITVTGTRVANGNNSPTPVTVLNTEQIGKLLPTTLTEQITLLPSLQGSQNVTSRPGGGQRNGAGAYFNLRNMGNLRTLVLYDGLRLVPTINQNEGDVDAAIVPQMLIKRVDVVTGGVSAVYGSDAVSGVVNFITDRAFNGIKIQASDGISTYGDDHIWDIGIAAGTKLFGGRGHVEVSYQYHNDPGILTRVGSDRAFFARNTGNAGAGTAANPFFNIPDMRLSNTTFGGLIVATSAAGDAAALRGLMFTPTGGLTPFVHGLIPIAGGTLAPFGTAGTLASTNVESGGSGGWFPTSNLKAGIDFHQAFGRFDYEVTNDVHFYAQVGYSNIFTFNTFRSPNLTSNAGLLRISYANPFLLSAQEPYRSLFLANPTRTFQMNEILLNDPRAEQRTKAYEAYVGLDGSLFGKFKWNVNYGRSQSTIKATDLRNIDRGRLFAALDAVDQGLVTTGVRNGNIVCRAGLTFAGHVGNPNYANCVPLNLFGQGRPSDAALSYLYQSTFNKNTTRLDDLNGSITGAPFSTWAGPVNMALSADWRNLRWSAVSNTDPAQFADCAGIAFNCTQGTTLRWFNNTMAPVAPVSQKVGEVAYEIDIPLLKDVSFAQGFDVTGAVRRTHYSTSGNATTWKLGADWRIISDLKLRATRSRDIRAPNLFELYTSTQINTGITALDPLTTTQFAFANTQTGNPNLTPEKADTLTVGAVFTPTFIPRFSLSVDYYKIKVSDVIFLLQGFSAQVLQACVNTKGASPACALVTRPSWTDTNPATNPITATTSTYLNIAAQNTWGVDAEASYRFDLFGRALNLRGLVSYQPKLDYDQGPAGLLSVAGAYNAGSNRINAAPKWRVTGVGSYDVSDNITVSVLERWRSSLNAIYDTTRVLLQPKLPAVGYTTLNVDYHQDTKFGRLELFLNVANLFNKYPTVYYSGQITQPGTQQYIPEGDDPIGRYFTFGVRWKF